MASLDFEKEKNLFKEYYHTNVDLLLRAETAFRVLVRSLLANVDGLEAPVVTSRLKDCDGCIKKFQL